MAWQINDENLENFDVIIFLSTTGDILDEDLQSCNGLFNQVKGLLVFMQLQIPNMMGMVYSTCWAHVRLSS